MAPIKIGVTVRLVIALVCLAAAGCSPPPVNRNSSEPLTSVTSVDLDRYLGRWYEIARYENRFEKNCGGVTADYSMRDDGLIGVVNTCREGSPSGRARTAHGKARIVDEATNAKLEVSFFGPFWGDYWIIDLAEDYSRAIVGEPEGRYLWVLARTPTISDASRAEAVERLISFGYQISALHFTAQPPVPDEPAAE